MLNTLINKHSIKRKKNTFSINTIMFKTWIEAALEYS